MKKKLEKRHCTRIHVPDATVRYRMKGIVSFPDSYSAASFTVNNLSIGGINFFSHNPLVEGKPIQIVLSSTGLPEPCELLGKVVWMSPTGKQQFQVGVEFEPYAPGGRRGCNTIESLQGLMALEAMFRGQSSPKKGGTP